MGAAFQLRQWRPNKTAFSPNMLLQRVIPQAVDNVTNGSVTSRQNNHRADRPLDPPAPHLCAIETQMAEDLCAGPRNPTLILRTCGNLT